MLFSGTAPKKACAEFVKYRYGSVDLMPLIPSWKYGVGAKSGDERYVLYAPVLTLTPSLVYVRPIQSLSATSWASLIRNLDPRLHYE